jgi:hypothetical protein
MIYIHGGFPPLSTMIKKEEGNHGKVDEER